MAEVNIDFEQTVSGFLAELENRYAPLAARLDLAWWNMETTGQPEAVKEWEQLSLAVRQVFSNRLEFERVQGWFKRRRELSGPLLRRQLEVVYAYYLDAMQEPAEAEEQARLEAQVEEIYNNYRGTYQGRRLTDNELKRILETSRDTSAVRKAYLASKEVGGRVAATVLKLAGLRNSAARALGYRDHYARALAVQELDESELFSLLVQLETATAGPFRQAKAGLDRQLVARFSLNGPDELRPWHYGDPFFQAVPAGEDDFLENIFQSGKEIEELTLRTYDGLGLEVRDVLAHSDLYEREGKSQHAFCQHLDRRTRDVRVLCNLQPTPRWMETSLHEFGHAVYDKYLAEDLPFWLRSPAHISTTEAIAMLLGRLATNRQWLAEVKGLSSDRLNQHLAALDANRRFALLLFVRWCLVMIYFERDLYANPARPGLNSLWWDYVERFQFLRRPEDRDAPDWAAKLHLASAPAYYQNYLLGELTASQLQAYIEREIPGHSLVLNRPAGDYLLRLFELGNRFSWNETLEKVTGEPLNPAYFVAQATGPVSN